MSRGLGDVYKRQDQIYLDYLEERRVRSKVTRIQQQIKSRVLNGMKQHFLTICMLQKSIFQEQKWFSQVSNQKKIGKT